MTLGQATWSFIARFKPCDHKRKSVLQTHQKESEPTTLDPPCSSPHQPLATARIPVSRPSIIRVSTLDQLASFYHIIRSLLLFQSNGSTVPPARNFHSHATCCNFLKLLKAFFFFLFNRSTAICLFFRIESLNKFQITSRLNKRQNRTE